MFVTMCIYIYCYVSIYKYIKVQRIYATYIRIYDRCIAIYIYTYKYIKKN